MFVFSNWLLSFLVLILSCFTTGDNTDTLPLCYHHVDIDRSILLVSTLDGYFSALNIKDGGIKKWNILTEPGPLLSSSIHKLELTDNSQWVRMIPSLNGGLYKFNGEYIQPIPVNAQNLLGSSFRFSDEVIISGGKEVRSYGIDITDGQILYQCSMNKCDNFTDISDKSSDMIVLQRDTQIVRAIEPRTGYERWNFSVGQHEVKLLRDPVPECRLDFKNTLDVDIKVIVPDGLIFAMSKSNPMEIIWKHKFDSPVVNAWSVIGSKLELIDLFGTTCSNSPLQNEIPGYPTVYIGMHKKQLYIQESVILQRQLQQADTNYAIKKEDQYPRIPWKPYPASGDNKRTNEDVQSALQSTTALQLESTTTALSVLYGSEYVNGNGYYLYNDVVCPSPLGNKSNEENISNSTIGAKSTYTENSEEESVETTVNVVIVSLWHWWKEVLVISVASAFILNCILFRHMSILTHYLISKLGLQTVANCIQYGALDNQRSKPSFDHDSGIDMPTEADSSIADVTYRSRYSDDFEPIHILGKGGFGVVFQAKNKIDDCHYAIKRITLPNREEARERVMREVKALAKLEHQNIVRYFNAWQECPPVGWQEERDKLWFNKTSKDFLSSTEETTRIDMTGTAVKSISKDRRNKQSNVTEFTTSSLLNFRNINKFITSLTKSQSSSFIIFGSKTKDSLSHNECTPYVSSASESNHADITKKSERRQSKFENYNPVKIPRIYLYIQMQLCQRNSLREWLQDNMVRDQNIILTMFSQIVQAVEYVHLQGLIHRDLKPSNIFFSPEGQIKIGDFGLVTAMTETEFSTNLELYKRKYDDRHTAYVGTELYMSPEQMDGEPYNYKVDIYSLGIILFELLMPFSTQMERYKTLMNLRNNKFPSKFNTDYKYEHDLLTLMLSPKPEKRPTTYGIKSRYPLKTMYPDAHLYEDWHFELPPRNNVTSRNSNPFCILPYANCEINIEA